MRLKFFLYVAIFLTQPMLSQRLFYQNTLKGGVSFDARSYGGSLGFAFQQPDTVVFQNTAPAGSAIKHAFLISRRQNMPVNLPPPHDNPINLIYNGVNIRFDSSDVASPLSKCVSQMNPSWYDWQWMSVKDVTTYTQPSGNQLITPYQNISVQSGQQYVYIGFGLLIIYEDNTMPVTNVAVFLNSTSFSPVRYYDLAGFNPINTGQDVGLSLWLSYIGYSSIPDSVNYVSNSSSGSFDLGNIYPTFYTNDYHSLPGSFYYQNNMLYGLVDDTPDPFIDSTDALANIKTYLSNNATTCTLVATGNVSPPGGCVDATNTIILAYSTPCPARSAAPAQTFSICSGQLIQLQSGTGSGFTWYPSAGLSDTTVSNPVANPTATTNYVVQVDSFGCKHTEHFRVDVYPTPKSGGITVSPAICGDARGTATVSPAHGGSQPYLYDIGSGNQTGNTFSNLQPGSYSLTITDSLGCTLKNSFLVNEINIADASFTIQPDTVCYPINPLIANNSSTVNNYSWYLNDSLTSGSQYPNISFLDTGFYFVTLIGWHNQPQCADTVSHSLYVKDCPPDSFSVTAPNVFTPNADGINDVWFPHSYQIGFSIRNYLLVIYDRWGIKVFETSDSQRGWDGRTASGIECVQGTYYFVLSYTANSTTTKKSDVLKGFLQLIR